jgi:hypothetical protein
MSTGGTDFQHRSTEEGRAAQDIAERVVSGAGFVNVQRNTRFQDLGVTVNIRADDSSGETWHFDVSGAFTTSLPGLVRTDTMWKALGRANVLHQGGIERLIILTTNLPRQGSVGDKALRAASATFFDAIEMMSDEGRERLRRYAAGSRQVPLPGLRPAAVVYPGLRQRSTSFGLDVSVPVNQLATRDLPAPAPSWNVQAMPHRLRVFLPSKTATGFDIPAARRNRVGRELITMLSDFAGGTTGVEAIGSWIDPIGGVMHERVSTIEAYAARPFPVGLVRAVILKLLADLEQHTAALLIDGAMHLVTPTT